jgi:hypothetical protein
VLHHGFGAGTVVTHWIGLLLAWNSELRFAGLN